MQFNKNKGMFLAAILIVLAVYNVVVFVLPFEKGGGFWTGYGFSMLAILLAATVGSYALGREGLRSKVYGVPLMLVAQRYLIIQLIVGLLEMALPSISFQYGIAVNTFLLGACLLGLVAADVGKEVIGRIDEKVKEKTFYLKSLLVDMEGLTDKPSDESVKKSLLELVETIRYSDPMSSPQLATIENKIETKVVALTGSIENADTDTTRALCNELQQLFAERNRKCKILK